MRGTWACCWREKAGGTGIASAAAETELWRRRRRRRRVRRISGTI